MTTNQMRSLENQTVIVTRAQEQQGQARLLFETLGARVLDLPALGIGPPDEWTPLDDALVDWENVDWIVFSSANGVRAVEDRLRLLGHSLTRRPKGLRIAVVGRKTANQLESIGALVDFVPPNYVAESLIEHFPSPKEGLRMLLPRVQSGGRTLLAKTFVEVGMFVNEVAAYESRCPETIPEDTSQAILSSEVDAIVFTSGKTVKHTFELLNRHLGKGWIHQFSCLKIVSIGPQTSLACKEIFKRVDQEADPHDMDGIISACLRALSIDRE